jgi:hypothetical protein
LRLDITVVLNGLSVGHRQGLNTAMKKKHCFRTTESQLLLTNTGRRGWNFHLQTFFATRDIVFA